MNPKKLSSVLVFSLCGSCTLTAPKGTHELMRDIEKDRSTMQAAQAPRGPTRWIKVRSYPRAENGNLIGKHWILMSLGSEDPDYKNLQRSLED